MTLLFPEQVVALLIPVVVKCVGTIFDRLPKWVVPALIVPGLGIAGQWFVTATAIGTGGAFDPVRGLILGALALLLRESSSQIFVALTALAKGVAVPRMRPSVSRRPKSSWKGLDDQS